MPYYNIFFKIYIISYTKNKLYNKEIIKFNLKCDNYYKMI